MIFPSSILSAADRIRNEHNVLRSAQDDAVALRARIVHLDPGLGNAGDEQIRLAAQDRIARRQDDLSEILAHRQAIEDASRSLPPLDTALKCACYEGALHRRLDRGLRGGAAHNLCSTQYRGCAPRAGRSSQSYAAPLVAGCGGTAGRRG